MLLFLTALFSQALALEHFETIDAQVIGVLPGNVIVISRGSDDSFEMGEHIRIFIDEILVSRAYATDVSRGISRWQLYRVMHPKKIIKGAKTEIESASQSVIPGDISTLETGANPVKQRYVDTANANKDFPTGTVEEKEQPVTRPWRSETWSTDNRIVAIDLGVGPVTLDTLDGKFGINTLLKVSNINGLQHAWRATLGYRREKLENPGGGSPQSRESLKADGFYSWSRPDQSTWISEANIHKIRYNNIRRENPLVRIGPWGRRWALFTAQNHTWGRAYFSAIPLFEYRKYSVISENAVLSRTQKGVRPKLEFEWKIYPWDQARIKLNTQYLAYIDLDQRKYLSNSTQLSQAVSLEYDLTKKLSLETKFKWFKDERLRLDLGLPSSQREFSLMFNWSTSL